MKTEVKEHFKKISDAYNSKLNLYCQKRFIDVIKFYLKNDYTVLDAGCGNGFIMDNLNENTVTGIDFCFEMLQRGTGKGFLCADAENIPFSKNTFDVVYSADLLEHVPNPSRMVSESSRVLKKNGKLIIITPNGNLRWILELLDTLKLKVPEGPHKFLKFKELGSILKKNNFKVIRHEKFIFFPKELPFISPLFEKSEKYTRQLCLFQVIVGVKK